MIIDTKNQKCSIFFKFKLISSSYFSPVTAFHCYRFIILDQRIFEYLNKLTTSPQPVRMKSIEYRIYRTIDIAPKNHEENGVMNWVFVYLQAYSSRRYVTICVIECFIFCPHYVRCNVGNDRTTEFGR